MNCLKFQKSEQSPPELGCATLLVKTPNTLTARQGGNGPAGGVRKSVLPMSSVDY